MKDIKGIEKSVPFLYAKKRRRFKMELKEKTEKELRAIEKVKRANAELAKIRREQRKAERKAHE